MMKLSMRRRMAAAPLNRVFTTQWLGRAAVIFCLVIAGCSSQQKAPPATAGVMPPPAPGAFPLLLDAHSSPAAAAESYKTTSPSVLEAAVAATNQSAPQTIATLGKQSESTSPAVGGASAIWRPVVSSTSKAIGPVMANQSLPRVPSHPTLAIPPTAYQPGEYHLNVGDQLEISVYRPQAGTDDDMHRYVLVGPDGKISYFFTPSQKAAGLTLAELQSDLTARLAQYVRSPAVSVTLAHSPQKRVYVVGEVVEEGVRQLDANNGDTVLDAIFACKGLTKAANLDQAYVIRRDGIIGINLEQLMFRGDQTQNLPLETGDVVYVPEAVQQWVAVMGYVQRPQAITVSRPISVTQAIAQAEGFRVGGAKDSVLIIRDGLRNGLQHPEILTVDMDQVLTGKAGDVYVTRGDIVYVPPTGLGSYNEVLQQLIPSLQALFFGTYLGVQL